MFCVCVSDSSSFPSPQPHSFQINFNSLYTALCEQQKSDQVTLLLYTLLHQNTNMRTYILSRTDMENLVRAPHTKNNKHMQHKNTYYSNKTVRLRCLSRSLWCAGVTHSGDLVSRRGEKLSSRVHGPHHPPHSHRRRHLQPLYTWSGEVTPLSLISPLHSQSWLLVLSLIMCMFTLVLLWCEYLRAVCAEQGLIFTPFCVGNRRLSSWILMSH